MRKRLCPIWSASDFASGFQSVRSSRDFPLFFSLFLAFPVSARKICALYAFHAYPQESCLPVYSGVTPSLNKASNSAGVREPPAFCFWESNPMRAQASEGLPTQKQPRACRGVEIYLRTRTMATAPSRTLLPAGSGQEVFHSNGTVEKDEITMNNMCRNFVGISCPRVRHMNSTCGSLSGP